MQVCDVFGEVRQRVAAYKYHCERYGRKCNVDDETLDEIYRFLFQSVDRDFLAFYAKKEGMTIERYINSVSYRENIKRELEKIANT